MRVGAAFSLKKALTEAFVFLPKAWVGAWLILLLVLVFTVGWPCLSERYPSLPLMPLFFISEWFLKLVALGALYRLAIFAEAARAEGLGFGGVQAGWPELRLFISQIMIALFVVLIAATLCIIFMIAFNLSRLGEGYADTLSAVAMIFKRRQGADWVFILYAFAAGLALLLLCIRLSLALAASVARHGVVTLNALGLSEGNSLKLLAGIFILALPVILIAIAYAHYTPEISPLTLPFYAGLSLVGVWLVLPLSAGFFASSYRQIVANRSK